ncbi:MAG: DUF4838 domain-containing protein, partial [Chloroflexi bacterium]|nr:DUF4838 domain-containing protein [Chloroflexota bacterium]
MATCIKASFALLLAFVAATATFPGGTFAVTNAADSYAPFPGWSSINAIHYTPFPDDPNDFLGDAAKELKTHLEQVAGSAFAIQTASVPSTGIFLSVAPDLPELAALGPESFKLFTDADGIHIIGVSPVAVRHGVYTLLEHLGFRWFFPHPAWSVRPETLEPLSLNETVSPYFQFREFKVPDSHFSKITNGKTNMINWIVRNRLAGGEKWSSGHSSEQWASRFELAESHPSAVCFNSDGSVAGIYFDHPEVIKRAIAYAKTQLDLDTISHDQTRDVVIRRSATVSPRDGASAACGSDDQDKSNRLFRMVNAVAKQYRSQYPDKHIGVYSYSRYWAVPDFPIEPNVYVAVTDEYRARPHISYDDRVAGFASQGVATGLYLYYDGWLRGWRDQIPPPGGSTAKEDALAAMLNRVLMGIAGGARTAAKAEGLDNWGPKGRLYYLYGKLIWDPSITPEAYLEDFYTRAFGPAYEPMKRYYTRFDTQEHTELVFRQAFEDLQQALNLAAGRPDVSERVRHVLMHAYFWWKWGDNVKGGYKNFDSRQDA